MNQRKLVRSGWLYDPVRRSLIRHGWLVINGSRVERRGEGHEAPPDLPTLDFTRSLVTPGLVDAHCHLTLPSDGTSPEDTVPFLSPAFFAAVAVSQLYNAASNGVTTVCDVGSPGEHLLRLRDHLAHPTTLPHPGAPRDRVEQRCAGIRKGRDVELRAIHHEVNIQRKVGASSQRSDDVRAVRQVRHKMAVHDVDMNPISSTCFDDGNLVGKSCEVRTQYAWCYTDALGHYMPPRATITFTAAPGALSVPPAGDCSNIKSGSWVLVVLVLVLPRMSPASSSKT